MKINSRAVSLRIFYAVLLIGGICLACQKKEEESTGGGGLKDVLISGLDSIYRLEPGTSLTLEPKVSFIAGKPTDSSRYRYEWFKLWQVGYLGQDDYTVISTVPQLTYQEPIQGVFDLLFRVTDLKTNLFTEKHVRVFVANAVYEGWMLLSEHNGQAQMDMLSYEPTTDQYKHIKDVLNRFHSQGAIQGKPLFVDFTAMSFFNLFNGGIVLGTNQGIRTYYNDDLGFAGTFQDFLPLGSLLDITETCYGGRLQSVFLSIDSALIVATNGRVEPTPSFRKINQLLLLDGTVRAIKTAPRVAIAKGYPSQQITVLFDETAKELLWFNPENSYCNQFGSGRLFNFRTGKHVLYLGYTEKEGGQYVALLQAPDTKEVYLARFSLYNQLYYEKIAAAMIEKAEQFALHPADGTLFYSLGSELYAIDESAKEGRLLTRFDGSVISKIKFNSFLNLIPRGNSYAGTTASEQRYKGLQNQLVVCTYDPLRSDTSGTFMLFDTDLQQWTLQERFRQEGFSKIIDVAYKER